MNEYIDKIVQFFFNDLSDSTFSSENLLHNVIYSFIIILVTMWLYKFSKKMMQQFISNVKIRSLLQVTVRNILLIISLLLLLGTWVNVKNSALLIAFAIIGIAAFSIKNLSTNLVAWFMLLRKSYFKLYDRIEIDDINGDVIKITPFYFKVMERGKGLSSSTATGRVIHVPNHLLLDNKLYNYNQFLPISWKEVNFKITVDSDWKRALNVVEKIGNDYMENFLGNYSEEELEAFETKSALFDEALKLKTYVLLHDDSIDIVAQVPVYYTQGTSTQSSLNKQIITQLNNLENVELNGKSLHMHIDNINEWKHTKS